MKPDIRVLVTGGRDFSDMGLMFEVLSRLTSEYRVAALIHGAARGLDTRAGNWANGYGIHVIPCPADWARYGKAAGPIRNGEMLRAHAPDVVIAFPGGDGTADMVRQATVAGVRVVDAYQYATDPECRLVVLAVDRSWSTPHAPNTDAEPTP